MADPLRFAFNASAAGVGARFHRIKSMEHHFLEHKEVDDDGDRGDQVDYVVPIQGASNLPVFGGLSESRVGPQSFKLERSGGRRALTLMSVGNVYTRAMSSHVNGSDQFSSEVEAHVYDLNFLDRIYIKYAAAKLTSSYPVKNPREDPNQVPHLKPELAVIEGLLLDGYPITVKLNPKPFCDHPTYGVFREKLPELRKKFPAQFGNPKRAEGPKSQNPTAISVCSLVEKIELNRAPKRKIRLSEDQRSIIFDGVGQLYFGELFMAEDSRRLSVFRVAFGSDAAGAGGGPEVRGNGGPVIEN